MILAEHPVFLKNREVAQPLFKFPGIVARQFCAVTEALLPCLPAVNKVKSRALYILNPHYTIKKTRRGLLSYDAHDLVSACVKVPDDNDLALKPSPHHL